MKKKIFTAVGLVVILLAAFVFVRDWQRRHVPMFDLASIGPIKGPTGKITGTTTYPSDYEKPDQKVCVQPVSGGDILCSKTKTGARFELVVPVGSYYVFASILEQLWDVSPLRRAYDNAKVKCGLRVECVDRTRTVFDVQADQSFEAQPHDWNLKKGELGF